jgi:hypothetical protein
MYLTIIPILLLISCSKFLDEKPDQKLSTISSLADCQALLDRRVNINGRGSSALEAAADNYFFNMDFWANLQEEDKNLYTWQPYNNYPDFGFGGNDWSFCYDNIFRSNTILEALEKIDERGPEYNNIKGQAYFLRANNYLQAAWTWCLSYNKNTARNDLGLPLRLDPDFNKVVGRSNLEDTYRQIIGDVEESIKLLPDESIHPYRSSKPAAYALLARIYLSMNEYDSVFRYCNLVLEKRSDLLNYNNQSEVALLARNPFKNFNREVLYEFQLNPYLINNGVSFVDTTLYDLYSEHDLRKMAFFEPVGEYYRFKGSYNDIGNFAGITTAEVYLMLSEAAARSDQMDIALAALNELSIMRYDSSGYTPFTVENKDELIELILTERRKELIMRGLRFMDIKRLNDIGYEIQLTRIVNGEEFKLPPRDKRFALPLPDDVIQHSIITQNPR